MSEEILRILLSELTVIRIVCKKCGSASEVPFGRLKNATRPTRCAGCSVDYRPSKEGKLEPDAFDKLADVMDSLTKLDDVECEFVLPVKPTKKK